MENLGLKEGYLGSNEGLKGFKGLGFNKEKGFRFPKGSGVPVEAQLRPNSLLTDGRRSSRASWARIAPLNPKP